jgi:hypothetical protein
MAREAETNPRIVPDARIAARIGNLRFSRSGHYPERHHRERRLISLLRGRITARSRKKKVARDVVCVPIPSAARVPCGARQTDAIAKNKREAVLLPPHAAHGWSATSASTK